jgi:hypothetical protein
MQTAIISYEEALDLYAGIILHTTGRDEFPMWAYMNNSQQVLILESVISALIAEDEFEKVSDLHEELEKIS